MEMAAHVGRGSCLGKPAPQCEAAGIKIPILHLEKAKALANTLTRTQSNPKAPGRFQTWLMQNPGPMWFNCELLAIRAMQELAAATTSTPAQPAATKPNILVILADDLGYGDIGMHGGKDVPTPHLDAVGHWDSGNLAVTHTPRVKAATTDAIWNSP
jgi:hypothetical protein